MTNQHRNAAKEERLRLLLYFAMGFAVYIASRALTFYNSDETNLLTGSRYCATYHSAWSIAWPLADCLLATLLPATKNPYLAISLAGGILSGLGALLAGSACRRLCKKPVLGWVGALLSSMWLVSPAGGWIVDSLSYCLGISPAIAGLQLRQTKYEPWIAPITGFALAVGLALKWNSFAPAFAGSLIFLFVTQTTPLAPSKSLLKSFITFSIALLSTSITCSLIAQSHTLYPEAFSFYAKLGVKRKCFWIKSV